MGIRAGRLGPGATSGNAYGIGIVDADTLVSQRNACCAAIAGRTHIVAGAGDGSGRMDWFLVLDRPNPRTVRNGHCGRSACQRKRRSEEHTSELQSLMRISYSVF